MPEVTAQMLCQFAKEHPDGLSVDAKGKSHGYLPDSENYKKFDEWYIKQTGGSLTTNRGNTYNNEDHPEFGKNRLTRHGRWDLARCLNAEKARAAKPPKAPKAEAKPEGDGKADTPTVRGETAGAAAAPAKKANQQNGGKR